jgi:hypothetical protein
VFFVIASDDVDWCRQMFGNLTDVVFVQGDQSFKGRLGANYAPGANFAPGANYAPGANFAPWREHRKRQCVNFVPRRQLFTQAQKSV